MTGTAGEATIRAIVRDFDEALLEQHAQTVRDVAERVDRERAAGAASRSPSARSTRTCASHIAPFPEVVAHAEAAIRAEGIEPVRTPIRGGTDGSMLSAKGLPTPNLFTGGHEYHSVREWASVQDMASAAAVAVRLAEAWARG